jgi:signal transduction histidine kinase
MLNFPPRPQDDDLDPLIDRVPGAAAPSRGSNMTIDTIDNILPRRRLRVVGESDRYEGAGHHDTGVHRRPAPASKPRKEAPFMLLMAIQALLRADTGADLLRLLADAAVAEVGADGAALAAVLHNGDCHVIETRGAKALDGWCGTVDTIDDALGERLLTATDGRFSAVRTLPLTSGGRLYGALVLFFAEPRGPDEGILRMAEALVGIAATELDKDRQRAEIRRSYEELRVSRMLLERTEKLRALGEMAAGISHDIVNILNPLSLHLQLLKRILKRCGEAAPGALDAVAEMDGVVKRGVQTVARLRDFSRQAPEAPIELVALDAIAHEAIELAHPRIASKRRAHGIQIVARFGGPPRVAARTPELMTALLNLLVNAVDAMEGGGTITVDSGAADGGAWVRVADDGPGIPEDLQRRIFEPFFTTKGEGGTGLGLSLVHACAQRYGGKLTLESAPGRGARFKLWFPVGPGDHGE